MAGESSELRFGEVVFLLLSSVTLVGVGPKRLRSKVDTWGKGGQNLLEVVPTKRKQLGENVVQMFEDSGLWNCVHL